MRKSTAILILLAGMLAACAAPSLSAAEPTHIPTILPQPTATAALPTPAFAASEAPIEVGPDVTCVPPSLMMHSRDRYALAQTIIPFLVQNGYTALTYRDYADILEGRRAMPERPVILSIDDIPSDYVNAYFRAMFESLHDAGLVATVAMNPNEPPEDTAENIQASWALVKSWSTDWGMAVETHTVSHKYLPGALPPELQFEIVESARRIEVGIGAAPVALVLPYGAEDAAGGDINAPGVLDYAREANLKFIVGITGGRQIDPTALPVPASNYPLYVGRVGANRDQTGDTLWEIAHWYCAIPACSHLAPIDCGDRTATLPPPGN